jgi:large subunit ribosomal protein L28
MYAKDVIWGPVGCKSPASARRFFRRHPLNLFPRHTFLDSNGFTLLGKFDINTILAILRKDIMSRTCEICGKHTITGNKVSHAKNRTRRTWKPNLVKVKTEIGGTALKVKICARCLKSDFLTKKV